MFISIHLTYLELLLALFKSYFLRRGVRLLSFRVLETCVDHVSCGVSRQTVSPSCVEDEMKRVLASPQSVPAWRGVVGSVAGWLGNGGPRCRHLHSPAGTFTITHQCVHPLFVSIHCVVSFVRDGLIDPLWRASQKWLLAANPSLLVLCRR